MKIEYINIHGYKNLNNIEMYFDEDSSVNAIIGNNGSGKSNILEAITIIFASVLEDTNPEVFEFCLKYAIDENKVEISNTTKQLQVLKNGKKVSKKDIMLLLPKVVFLYYAGETKRLKNFTDQSIDRRFEKILKRDEEIALKFLTYLSVDDFGPSLLSNHIYRNDTYYNICKLVDIKEICSPVTIKLRKPSWSKNGKADDFWSAIGAVAKVLNELAQKGRYFIIDNNRSEIVIDDIAKLKDDSVGTIGLFTIFKVLSQADILEGLQFDVIKGGEKFSYTNLSEGEKQLSYLLSILEITKEYRALFLLDEFDSYLHPKWQRKFVDIINEIDIRGQILFTTHSPLTLGKMKKNNILLLKEGVAYSPSSETFNRDVTEVLEELMDVKKRPPEVEELIINFRERVVQNDKDKAYELLDKLKDILSADDPFFINARISIARLER